MHRPVQEKYAARRATRFPVRTFFSVIKIPVSGNLYLQQREPLEEEGKPGEITGRRIYGRNFRKI